MNTTKVLIVDDDPDFGSFIKMRLSKEAPQLSIARVEGGPQCLEYLKDNPVDCIISDYQMPEMDGMELLLALKGRGVDVPFIFITAQGNEELAREAFKNGAHDYFTKEIGFAHFARIINSLEQAVQKRTGEIERRRAVDALMASQKYLQTIIDTEPECVKLLAPDGTLVMMNRAGLAMIEADCLEQVKGTSISDLVVPEYREAFNALGERVFQGGSGTLEFDMEGLKGRRLRLETHAVPLRNENDAITALLGVTRDITERGKAEEALKFKNALLLAQQEVSLDGIFMVDENDEIISYNKRFAEMWRIPPEVMATGSAERARLFVAPSLKDPEWFIRRLRSVYENRTEKSMDEIELKDGRTFVRYSDSIFGADGKYYGRVLYFSDITQRKDLERQRADFYAMVTHDLKSPLATILGYLELISKAAQSSEGGDIVGEMAKAARRSGEKLLKLTDDFMAASRLESGVVEVRTMPVEVAGLLLEVRDDFEPIAREKGIAFRADISDGLPLAALDKKQVERAVGNLLQNAFNYTPKGGEVKLMAEVVSSEDDKCVLFSVSDTGTGISQGDMVKIFDKYYRSPKTAGTKGTGLGLSIVKAIAEAHGGRVEVESEEGSGSTFRLFLPVGG